MAIHSPSQPHSQPSLIALSNYLLLFSYIVKAYFLRNGRNTLPLNEYKKRSHQLLNLLNQYIMIRHNYLRIYYS